jgi:hypothetical protein
MNASAIVCLEALAFGSRGYSLLYYYKNKKASTSSSYEAGGCNDQQEEEVRMLISNQTKSYLTSNREITNGTGNKRIGMYIGEQNNPDCKQNRNILVTSTKSSNYQDTITVTTNEEYKRNVYKNGEIIHRVGEKKIKKILRIKPLEGMNIRSAWESVFDYPTVSYGLNCFRREVLIVDSDIEYESLSALESIVNDFCIKSNLPKVSYIIRNPKTKHAQIGWFLDKPFENTDNVYNTRNFNVTIKRLSSVWSSITGFDADLCFNGPACKNPYYEDFESVIYNELPVNRNDFIQKLSLISSKYTLSSCSSSYNTPETDNKPVKITRQKTKKQIEETMFSPENGRNNYLVHYLDVAIFKEMNRCNGVAPTYSWVLEEANRLAEKAGKYFDKGPETVQEIKSTAKACLQYCINNYDSSYVKHQDTTNARGKSILVKKCNKLINAVEALSGKIEVSRGTLYRYKAMTEEDWNDLLEAKDKFLEYFKSIKENCEVMELSFDGYLVLEDRLCNLDLSVISSKYTLSSCSSSYNTPETVEKEEVITETNKPSRQIPVRQEGIVKQSISAFADLCNKPIRQIIRM